MQRRGVRDKVKVGGGGLLNFYINKGKNESGSKSLAYMRISVKLLCDEICS